MTLSAVKETRIITLGGTRPEIIKLAEFVKIMKGYYKEDHGLLYTGQHYSFNMKDNFFDQLGIKPDYDLKSNGSNIEIIKNQILEFLKKANPEFLIVYGDTYSTLGGAMAIQDLPRKRNGVKLIHLEAGIRDFDMTIPEERARIYVDSVSDYLMAPTELAKTFLFYEGISENVFVTGNLIVDVCRKMMKLAEKLTMKNVPSEYLLLTMHRQENVEDPETLERLRRHLANLKQKVVFPIHPRTLNNISKYGINLPDNVIKINAVGYLEFLSLLKHCSLVMTDSGGVTEEAIILKKPCITLRHSTARWETILLKANVLFPLDRKDALNDVINYMLDVKITVNPYGEDVTRRTFNTTKRIISSTHLPPLRNKKNIR